MAYLIELNLTKTLRDNLIEPDRVDNWLLCQSFALQRGGWEEPSPGCWPVEGHRASTGPGADILTRNSFSTFIILDSPYSMHHYSFTQIRHELWNAHYNNEV